MTTVERCFFLRAGELRVWRPGPVADHTAFLFCLLKLFCPADVREFFEFQFPSFSFTKVEKQCKQLAPNYRATIVWKYDLYPPKRQLKGRIFSDGMREGAKRMKQTQKQVYAQATPYIL